MLNAARAGILYFLIVFAIGFVLGALRTLVVAPRVGEVWAVAIELPFMIGASWLVCRWLVRRVPPHASARLVMGGIAFVLLMLAEFGMASLFGRSPLAFATGLIGTAGLLGLGGQFAFALMPLIMIRHRYDGVKKFKRDLR